jgi:sugar lactone lactonase YvrE
MPAVRKVAPEFSGALEWFNTETPLAVTSLRGHLVLLAFVESSSVESRRMLGELDRLGYRFQDRLLILCVHQPSLPAEVRRSHVQGFVQRNRLRFPLIHDPGHVLGARYTIRDLPALVLIDADGLIVGTLNGARELAGLQAVIRHQLDLRTGRSVSGAAPVVAGFAREPDRVLRFPARIVLAGDRMYVSDSGHNRVLVLSAQGNVIRQYGANAGGFVDGIADSAAFSNPQGLALVDDFLYVADAGNHAIRRIELINGEVVTVAGDGTAGGPIQPLRQYPADTPMSAPFDVVRSDGRLYIAMAGADQIWSLSLLTNSVELLAGSGARGQVDGKSAQARLAQPTGLALGGRTLYCADALTSALRCVDVGTGSVGTLAGRRERIQQAAQRQDGADPGDGLQFPQALVMDAHQRRLWIADSYNNRICMLDIQSSRLSTVVRDAGLLEPAGLAIGNDTLYIANTNAHAIMRVKPDQAQVEVLNVSEENSEF